MQGVGRQRVLGDRACAADVQDGTDRPGRVVLEGHGDCLGRPFVDEVGEWKDAYVSNSGSRIRAQHAKRTAPSAGIGGRAISIPNRRASWCARTRAL